MKKILKLLTLCMFCAIGMVQAQSKYMNVPDTVCMSTTSGTADQAKFTSVNALMTGGNKYSYPANATWKITTPSGTDADYNILYSANASPVKATKLVNTTSLTLEFLTPGTYVFKAYFSYKVNNGPTQTDSVTKTLVAMDCTISTCNGGYAVMAGFNEDFGTMAAGVNRRPYPVSGVVQYLYQATGDLADEYYTIGSTTQQKPDWVKLPDHTGNANGAMLVANSAYNPSQFYQKTVTGLCSGSIYNFSAWILNINGQGVFESGCVSGYQYAGVTFQVVNAAIPTQVLATFKTYAVSMMLPDVNAKWQRYGGQFQIPSGVTDVIVRIINNKPGGCGNDIAIDDINFTYCSPIITAGLIGNNTNLKEVLCEGTPDTLTSSIVPAGYFTHPIYQWEMSDDNGTTWFNVPYGTARDSLLKIPAGELKGTKTVASDYLFRVRVYEQGIADSLGCANPSSPIKITILPMPILSLTKSQVCAGADVELEASGGFDKFTWRDLPGYVGSQRTITLVYDTTIMVYGYVFYGEGGGKTCVDSNSAFIKVDDKPVVDVAPSTASICYGEVVDFKINSTLAGKQIRWYHGYPGGPIDTTLMPEWNDQTVIEVTPGNVNDTVYSVIVTSGTCEVTSSPLIVKITKAPPVIKFPPIVACASANPTGVMQLPDSTQAGITGNWYIVSYTGFDVAPDETVEDYVQINNPKKMNTKVTIPFGSTVVLGWLAKPSGNATCVTTSYDTLSLLNNPTYSFAGDDSTHCGTADVFIMAASAPDATLTGLAAETGTWTLISGTATITDIHNPTTTVTVPGIQDAVLQWTITSVAGCTSNLDTVVLHKVPPPTAVLKAPITICSAAGTFDIDSLSTTGNPTLYTLKAGTPALPGFVTVTNATLTWPITVTYPTGTLPAANSYNFILSVANTNAGCTTDIPFSLNVSSPPTAPTALTVVTPSVCDTGSTVLTATGGVLGKKFNGTNDGKYYWFRGTCGGVPFDSSITNSIVVHGIDSTTTFYVRIEGTCGATACVSGTVTRYAKPANANAGPDQDHCMNPVFKMAANKSTVVAGTVTTTWTVLSGKASIITPSSDTSTILVANGDSAYVVWTIKNGTCSTSDTAFLRNYITPTVAAAGPDQNKCMTPSFTLAGNVPTLGTGKWTLVKGVGTITTPTSAISTVTVANGDSAYLVWTITNGLCSTTDTVILRNSLSPTVSAAGPDQNKCMTTAFTLAGNVPTIGTGKWTLVKGIGTIATPTLATSGVTVANGDSAYLVWTITNGACTSTDTVVLRNYKSPTTSAAGPDQNKCMTPSFTLAGNVPTLGTGVWTLVKGVGTITTPTSATSTVTVANGDSAYLVWTITNGVCTSTDTVILRNSLSPTVAAAGPDQNKCVTSAFTLAGNVPTVGTGLWTLVKGVGTITTPTSATSGVTVAAGDSAYLVWTITNGVCTSTDTVVLRNYKSPTPPNAGPDQSKCMTPSFTLAGNVPTLGTGVWSLAKGTATITTPTSATSAVTVPNGDSAYLVWTITNGVCISTDTVVLRNNLMPTAANAGADQNHCATPAFTLAGNAASIGSGIWTLVKGTATITTPTSPTSAVTVATGDSAYLVWTITNGLCSTNDTVILRNYQIPTVSNAGPDQNKCMTSAFTLAGNIPTVGKGIWTLVKGTATITTPTLATSGVTVANGDSAYLVWTVSNGTCTSSTDTVILRNYKSPTTAAAGPDLNQCVNPVFTLAGNTPTVGTGVWTLVKGTGTITTPNSPTSGATVAIGDTAVLVWTITNGLCVSTDTVVLRDSQKAVDAAAGPAQEHCGDSVFTMAANTPDLPTAVGTWTVVSPSTVKIAASEIHKPNAVINVPAGVTATLTWTISNLTCSTSSNVTLTNFGPILGNTITANQTLCATETPATLNGGVVSGGKGTYAYQWVISTDSISYSAIGGATNPTYSPGVIAVTTWFKRVVSSGACAPDTSKSVRLTLITMPPVVVSVPAAITTDCVQGKDYTTLFGTPTFSHAPYNGEALTVSSADVVTVVDPCTTTIKRTWTATDRCGLTTSAQQTITVVDTKPPVFTTAAPANITVNCDAVPAAVNLTAKDDCAGMLTVTPIEVRQDIPGTCTSNYLLLRKWVVSDNCGNVSDTLRQTVTVKDLTPPVFTMTQPANITVDCDKVPAKTDLTATDNCTPGVITVTPTDSLATITGSTCKQNYKIIRKWVATDNCGNTTTLRQTITVQDTSRPVFSVPQPANVTVDCDKVPALPTITATDNCTAVVNVTVAQKKVFLSATCSNNYQLTRTWTAKDDCGNTATMSQIIVVQDTTRPTFTVIPPADTTVSCDAIPSPSSNLSAIDNCSATSNVKISYTQTRQNITGACAGNYQLLRTWTAKDECGNSAVIRQTITVVDTTKPVVDPAPANITVNCGESIQIAATLYARDNCDATFPKKAIMTEDPYVKDVCAGYTITRRWTITDACGNQAIERVQVITVNACPKPELDPTLPVNCSNNTKFAILLKNKVSKPKFTLVSIFPASTLATPLTQTSNVFDLKGATQATFTVTDGITGCVSDPVTYDLQYTTKPVVNLGNDTAICSGNTLTLDAGINNAAYTIRWSTGETSQLINVAAAGTYSATVTNAGCSTTDSIKVKVNTPPVVNIPDANICEGQSVKLNAYVQGATYVWNTGDTGPSITVSQSNMYWVDVTLGGCTASDTVTVTANPAPNVVLTSDTSICPNESMMLTVEPDGGTVRWLSGETTNSIVVSKPGDYWVTVTRSGCVVSDTVKVGEKPALAIDLGPDRDICIGGRVVVDGTNPDAISYLWNDGDTNPVKEITQPGKYIISVMDKFCSRITMDSVNVTVAGIPAVLLGNDTTLCNGQTLNLTVNAGAGNSIRWQDGSTSSTFPVKVSGYYTVTVYNDCGTATDQIAVTFKQCETTPQFPNAFTPNGDGKNDTFKPVVQGPMYDYQLQVYNRWGELIFMSKDSQVGWNGKYGGRLVENGTYVWMLTYKKVMGGSVNVVKGEITVIR